MFHHWARSCIIQVTRDPPLERVIGSKPLHWQIYDFHLAFISAFGAGLLSQVAGVQVRESDISWERITSYGKLCCDGWFARWQEEENELLSLDTKEGF